MKKSLLIGITTILTLVIGQLTFIPASATPACTITVTASNTTVEGTSSGDVICLNADNLTVNALGGNDTVIDNGTNNTIYLGEGLDVYIGTDGEDGTVDGGPGADQITGTPGEDELTGGDGDDTLIGGDGNDTLNGGLGNDELQGNAGEDILNGDAGLDELDGGDDPDTLNGGPDADLLIGGEGNDTMNGGLGNDELAGGIGDDSLFGESGTDTLRGEEGDDIVAGGADLDSLNGGGGLNFCDYDSGEPRTSTCRYDDSSPVISGLSWTPDVVEVGTTSATTRLRFSVRDDTGIASAMISCNISGQEFRAVVGRQQYSNSWIFWTWDGVESRTLAEVPIENIRNVEFNYDIVIPYGFQPGTYSCYGYTSDTLGKQSVTSSITQLVVNRTGDNFDDSSPVISGLSWTPDVVEVGTTSATTRLRFSVRDDTGIASAMISCNISGQEFRAVVGRQQYSNSWIFWTWDGVESRTLAEVPIENIRNVEFNYDIVIPYGFQPGTYSCYGYTSDTLGKQSVTSSITQLVVNRTGDNFDDSSPVISGLSWTPDVVEVGTTSATTRLRFSVRDDTGIASAMISCNISGQEFRAVVGRQQYSNSWIFWTWDGVESRTLAEVPIENIRNVEFNYDIVIPYGFQPGTYSCYGYTSDTLGKQSVTSSITQLVVNRTPTGQPSSPTSVTYTPINPTSGTLSWSPPVELGSPNMYAYVAEISLDGTNWNELPNGATTGTSLSISNLQEGTKYWLRVRGENGGTKDQDTRYMNLNWGVVEFTTPQATAPDAPTNLVVSNVASNSFRLAWTAPTYSGGRDINNFTVEYSTDNGSTWRNAKADNAPASTSLSFNVTTAAPATRYLIRVAAVNIIGASEYLTGEVRTLATVPTAPRSLTTSNVSSNSLTLSWQLPSSNGGANITDYKVEYAVGTSNVWTEITHEPSNNLAFNVTSLRSNQPYRFRVSAINEGGVGAASNIVSVTTLAGPPQEPTNLTTSGITSTGASLRWTAPANTGGVRITDYQVQTSRDGGNTWNTVTKRTSTSTSLALTGLAAATTYQVRVAAVNARGAGATATTSFTTLAGPPSAPTNLRSSDVTGTTATIAWDLPPSNGGSAITNYRVEVSSNCRTYTVLPRTASNSLAQNVTNLQPGLRYCFRVSTITAIGTGPASTVLTVTTIGNAPNAPTALAVQARATQVTLSWRAATVTGGGPVRNYLVEYSTNGGASWINVTKPVSTSTSLAIRNLTRSTAYLFRVYAVNDSGTSPASANLAVTTPAR